MKKLKTIFVVSGLLCGTVLSFAQTNPGDVLIGTSTRLNLSVSDAKWKSDDGEGDLLNTFNLGLTPQIGVFVVKGLAIGIEVPTSYQSIKYENMTGGESKESLFSINGGPFIRYYFNTPKIKPFLNAGIGYGYYAYYDEYYDSTTEETFFNYNFGAGVAFFITEKISLDVLFDFSSNRYGGDNDDNYREINNTLGADIGFTLVL